MKALSDYQYCGETWGKEDCWLRMPEYLVEFRGLSTRQACMLSDQFDDFLLRGDTTVYPSSQKLQCDVYRLDKPLDIPRSYLEEQGLYSPIQIREGDYIKVIGHDFIAKFSVCADNISCSSLGVYEETDFEIPSIVENFLRYFTAYYAVCRSGAMLHSAGLVVDQHAMVFAGYSNVGKTTLTRKAYADDHAVLSDDINLILPTDFGYVAHKVPFTGEFGKTVEQTGLSTSYPLRVVALLEQGDALDAKFIPASSAVSRLLTASPFVNSDDSQLPQLFDIYSDLVSSVPVIKLTLTRDCKFSDIMHRVNDLIGEV